MNETKDRWDRIHYPELTDAENAEIRQARRRGFATFYTMFPTAESQSRKTLAGARRFMLERDEDAVAGETCRPTPDEP